MTSHWGGTETVVLETCRQLRVRGHHSEIVSTRALASADDETVAGVPVSRFPYFYPYLGLSPQARRLLDMKGGNLFSFALMRHLMRRPCLDLVHLHTGNRIGGIVRKVAQQRGIPYVVSLHGGVLDVPVEEAGSLMAPTKGTLEWGKVLGWWVGARRVLSDAAAIVCVGRAEQEHTQARFPGKRVVYMPNGVDTPRFATGHGPRFRARHGIPQDAFLVIVVARIDPQKNQALAVRMMEHLPAHARLLCIGHVTHEPYARQLPAEMVLPGLDASSQELVDAYHAADLFLLPSVHEPFGIVILEAWAAGRPVVASRVGGIPGFVRDGEDALLFESQNLPQLTAHVRLLMEQPERRAALAAAGHARVSGEFSWEAVTDRLLDLYSEVRSNSSASHRATVHRPWRSFTQKA
ncbi:MAG: glycosyltransferase family 4 protein [Candidatus Xenobia bacterium]